LLLTIGATSQSVAESTLREWVRLEETSPGVWTLVIDRALVDERVAQLKVASDRPAVDATLTFAGVEPVVSPSQIGSEMDAVAATEAIVASLTARGEGTPPTPVTLPVVTTQPEVSTEDAQALVGQVELLGTWTTHYVPSKRNNNGQNIRRPADLIDGTIVQPGAVFDFVEVAGPITRANGYGDGAAIIGGNTRDEGVLGGGLCSASTTLFNAALRAGFDIGARRNHAYYIDRYPVGLDATIWISGSYVQTTSFTNDTAYPIVVRGINFKRKVTFEIWGVSDGRTVSIANPIVTNEREANNYYEFTDELPPRVTEREEYAADGFNSSVGRTVRDRNGNILHQDTFRSDYRRVDGIVLVGRMPGDPVAGTRIPYRDGLPPAPNPTDPPDPDPTDPPTEPTAPTAKFGFSVGADGEVQFEDRSEGDPDSWLWDFAGEGTSDRRNPKHTFAGPGEYSVTLTVTNENGSTSRTRTVVIAPPPG
jgi:vancomycin resistance protein YoaR